MPRNLNAAVAADTGAVVDFWPDPIPLPEGLPPVVGFDLELLPEPFRAWVGDIAERMQAPADFVGVTAMVAAGAAIGSKIGIRPQRNTDWQEAPNLWGCIVGRPGVMKSPCVKAALAPLRKLEAAARDDHQAALADYKAGDIARELQAAAIKDAMKSRLKDDPKADLSDLVSPVEEEPKATRYIVNDLGLAPFAEILRNNAPNGVLAHRDELMGLVKALEDDARVEERAFYLSGWSGWESYTVDRIGRGFNLHVPSVTISLLGSTQPGKIRETVARALSGGSGDDGLIQRFGMIVWPDLDPDWREVDREPDAAAKAIAYRVFERLAHLTPDAAGATLDEHHPDRAFLRFDEEAQDEFRQWYAGLERRLRGGELHPAVESHLAKYRKLIPALALIHHLASGGYGPVGLPSLLAACAWGEYLESHASRVYGAALDDSAFTARTILQRLASGKLETTFTVRELHQRGWAGLSDREAVARAVERLEAHHYIRLREVETGGRPSLVATANPKVVAKA